MTELKERNISLEQIKHAEYLSKKAEKIEQFKLAKESFTLADFIFHPFGTLISLTFAWEYKKDGLLRKAEQQKKFRIGLLIVSLIIVIYLITRK